jgi:protein-disulfide isomerase
MADCDQPRHLRKLVIAISLSFLFLQLENSPCLSQTASSANSPPSDDDRGLQAAIHDYILAHPEVLIESLQRTRAEFEAQQAATIRSRISAFRKHLVEDPNAPVLGNPKGDVTLVEFFDYFVVRSSRGCRR